MNRRGFLQSIAAAALGLTLARTLPGIAGDAPSLSVPVVDSATFAKGDVFTIDGVYAINPATGSDTGILQRFVVTEDVTADGVLDRSWPECIAAGEYANVSCLPAPGAVITVHGGPRS